MEPRAGTPSDRRRQNRQRRDRVPGCLIVRGGRVEVIAWDVSTSGAGLTSRVPIALNEVVQLRIGIGPARIPVPCRVVRCDAQPDGSFNIGVEFVNASPRFLAQERLESADVKSEA